MARPKSPILFDGGIPSNFFRATIKLPNPLKPTQSHTFPTNEHYFHCCKVATSHRGTYEMYREIRTAPSPAKAKLLGQQVPMGEDDVELWDTRDALMAMLECNLAKYTQNERCRKWLLGTGDRRLVEHRQDNIWGDGLDGTGRNLLGRVLELVRARIC